MKHGTTSPKAEPPLRSGAGAPFLRRFETIEQLHSHYQMLAPVGLVQPPEGTPFGTVGEKIEWYQAMGDAELVRLRDQALAQLETDIARIEGEISSTNEEIADNERATEFAEAEAAGILALPSIVEFDRLTAAAAKCDERIATVLDQERLLAGFGAQQGLKL